MTRQKKSSSEQHLRSVTHAAEAVALGTMAGGLALGAVQAREAQPLPDEATEDASVAVVDVDQPTVEQPHIEPQQASVAPIAEDQQVTLPAGENRVAEALEGQFIGPSLTPPAPENAAAHFEPANIIEVSEANTDTPASQHLSGVIEQLVADVVSDDTIEGSALPLAGKILESIADIVSTLKPGLDVSALSNLGNTLQGQVETVLAPTTGTLADLPDTIADTIDTALDRSGLGDLADDLAIGNLPASLLGSDGPLADGGLLASLFYSDGEAEAPSPSTGLGQSAESLFIPEMSHAASHSIGGALDGTVGLLGLSYSELSPDGNTPASGGIGGLGLL